MLRLVLVATIVSLVTVKSMADDLVEDPVKSPQTAAKLLQNARDIMKRFDAEYSKQKNTGALGLWNFLMNSMDENLATKENDTSADTNFLDRNDTSASTEFLDQNDTSTDTNLLDRNDTSASTEFLDQNNTSTDTNLLDRNDTSASTEFLDQNDTSTDTNLLDQNDTSTDTNLLDQNDTSANTDFLDQIIAEANAFPWRDLEDEYVKRQFKKFCAIFAAVPENESLTQGSSFAELYTTILEMKKIHSTAKICDFKNKTKCDLELLPEITKIMIRSRNPEELKYIWVEWRKVSGEPVKSLYPKYVEYANNVARSKNFSDYSAYWMKDYEIDDFPEQIETIWQQLKPLYLQLHAYVRRELRKKYGEDIVSKDGPIPAHLLGNMWAQSWSNIAKFTAPFPGKQMPDVTAALLKQGYNATGIFRLAEDFYKSINLSAMPDTFWERSILEKQEDVEMSCVATAWDFYDGRDFRISQCTRVNMENLLTAHHEMGHVEYYMQYKDQPALFKEGANPGFHEAVANAITLSVSTPGHLKKIGLLGNDSNDSEASLNHLYLMSLEDVAFQPFAYMIDQWRWNIFQGNVTPDNYNCHWWSLAAEYQGIEPPVDRSEEDFDPGSKFDIIANVDYIKHFVSYVLQLQFHKALCTKARQYNPNNSSANPLHQCDIYKNKDAGNLLKSMMELGSSKPWPDALEKITGQRQMDAAGILEYFQPLMDWLTEENKKTNEYIGWKPSNRRCVKTRKELAIRNTSDGL